MWRCGTPFLSAFVAAVMLVACAAPASSTRRSASQPVSAPPAAARAVEAPTDVAEADVQSSLSFVYEDRLTDEDIFLEWLEVKIDGRAAAENVGQDFAPGPHKMDVEARFGKLREETGIVFKKKLVVVVQPERSTRVHLVVRDVAGEKLAAQLAPELMVKLFDSNATGTAAVPLPKDGPPPKARKAVPIVASRASKLTANGSNLVRVCVSETGAVEYVGLVKPLHPSFDGPVLDGISRWVFKPSVQDGRSVPFCYVQKNVAQ